MKRTAVQRKAEREVTAAETARAVLDLRKGGATYAEIASKLALSGPAQAYRVAQRAIADLPRESAEEVRAIELERLEAMHRAVWDAALSGDLDAFDRALRASESRRKLMGANAPEKYEHAHSQAQAEWEQLPARDRPAWLRAQAARFLAAAEAEEEALKDAAALPAAALPTE